MILILNSGNTYYNNTLRTYSPFFVSGFHRCPIVDARNWFGPFHSILYCGNVMRVVLPVGLRKKKLIYEINQQQQQLRQSGGHGSIHRYAAGGPSGHIYSQSSWPHRDTGGSRKRKPKKTSRTHRYRPTRKYVHLFYSRHEGALGHGVPPASGRRRQKQTCGGSSP
ncbi:unnamed protein product [Ixodes pacificus]